MENKVLGLTYSGVRLKKIYKWTPFKSTSEWVEENVKLDSASSPISGNMRLKYTPHVIEVFEDRDRPEVYKQVLMWSSQTAKTVTLFNMVAKELDTDPTPCQLMIPTSTAIPRYLDKKLNPFLNGIKSLKSKTMDYTSTEKLRNRGSEIRVAGGGLSVTGSSRGDRKSLSIKYFYADEIAEFEAGAVSEAIERPLALNTPIPTPKGWSTMGKLSVGDFVFDENGNATEILKVTDEKDGVECFDITFSTGETITCDGDHEWVVEVVRGGTDNRLYVPEVIEARDLYKKTFTKKGTIKTQLYMRIKSKYKLEYTEKSLPIEPYTLGVWLGDGTQSNNYITSHIDDVYEINEYIQNDGFRTLIKDVNNRPTIKQIIIDSAYYEGIECKYGHNVEEVGRVRLNRTKEGLCSECFKNYPKYKNKDKFSNFTTKLLDLGLLRRKGVKNQGKFIPEDYLLGSRHQRLELLRGLMDTDGTCGKTDGRCSIVTKYSRLADEITELCISLGLKVNRRVDVHNKKDYYKISFMTYDDLVPFKLKRKINNINKLSGKKSQPHYRDYIYIKSIKPTESVKVKCIRVKNKSHQFLCGKTMIPTHNTKSYSKFFRKILLVSTMESPNDEINTQYESCDIHKQFEIQCTYCGEFFYPESKDLKYLSIEQYKKPVETKLEQATYKNKALSSVRLECPSCSGHMTSEDRDRQLLNDNHRWKITKGDEKGLSIGYKANALAMFFTPLEDIVELLIDAKFSPIEGVILDKIYRGYFNEFYETDTEEVDKNDILLLSNKLEQKVIPKDTYKLYLTIDTQKTGFWFKITAVEYGVILNTVYHGFVETFDELELLMGYRFKDEDNNVYIVDKTMIDRMGIPERTAEVDAWIEHLIVKEGMEGKIYPTMGVQNDASGRLWYYTTLTKDVTTGDRKKTPIEAVKLNNTLLKNELQSYIDRSIKKVKGEDGYENAKNRLFYINETIVQDAESRDRSLSTDYERQMTSEHYIYAVHPKTGTVATKKTWEKLNNSIDNHLWDNSVQAVACALMDNVSLAQKPADDDFDNALNMITSLL
jgi:hypothetical protein